MDAEAKKNIKKYKPIKRYYYEECLKNFDIAFNTPSIDSAFHATIFRKIYQSYMGESPRWFIIVTHCLLFYFSWNGTIFNLKNT